MPSARMIFSDADRSIWYSLSESVWLGATTIESPVWMPIGSRFSMLQMVMQLSAPSRITSYSISFQPVRQRSTSTWPIGLASMPPGAPISESSSVSGDAAAGAAERVGGADDQRQAAARRRRRAPRRALSTIDALGTGSPSALIRSRNTSRSSAMLDRVERRAEQPDAVALQDARRRASVDRQVERRLPAQRRQQPVRPLRAR